MITSRETKNAQEESPVISESTLGGEKVDLAKNAGKKLLASGDEVASLEIKGNPDPVNPAISGDCQTLQADLAATNSKSHRKLIMPAAIQQPQGKTEVWETVDTRFCSHLILQPS